MFISEKGVRSIWLRRSLYNFKKRLKALEEKVATKGIQLNDAHKSSHWKRKLVMMRLKGK